MDIINTISSFPIQIVEWVNEFIKWFLEFLHIFKDKIIEDVGYIHEKIITFKLIPEITLLGVSISMGQFVQFLFLYV